MLSLERRIAKDSAQAVEGNALDVCCSAIPADAPPQHRTAIVLLAAGVTHQSIADRLGVTRESVTRWRSEYRNAIDSIRTSKTLFLQAIHSDTLILASEIAYRLADAMLRDDYVSSDEIAIRTGHASQRGSMVTVQDFKDFIHALNGLNRMVTSGVSTADYAPPGATRATRRDVRAAVTELRKISESIGKSSPPTAV